jgi:TolB-like protein
VSIVALALGVSAYWAQHRAHTDTGAVAAEKTLAVLPFTDLSEDASQAWLAEGMAEELRAGLIRLRGLQVAGGLSSSRFSSELDDLRSVAEDLEVQYLLLGSVMQAGERLRVTSRLVDASTGFHLWSEVFDRPRADLFAVRAEISESVAVALSIALGVGELGMAPGGTSSIEAFELHMRGRTLYEAFTSESMTEAITLLNRAVELDPQYTEAWAWLATLCYLAPMAFDEAPPVDFLSLSQSALERAMALDPDSPAVLPAVIDLHGARHEWGEVERKMREASKANVAFSAEVHFSYGVFLTHMGRAKDAQSRLLHARRLEPLAPSYGSKLGHAYVLNGRLVKALAEHERVWNLGYGNRYFQSTDGLIAALAARDAELIAKWLRRVAESADPAWAPYFKTLEQTIADPKTVLEWLRQCFERGAFMDYWVAVFAAYLGDPALALEALLRSPDGYALWTPLMADVRRQPEFRQVVHLLGLPAYWRAYTWADFCHPVGSEDFACE